MKTRKRAAKSRFVIRADRKGDWPFSDGVWVGSTFYLSGHIGFDPATGKPPADVTQEAKFLLDGFAATLAAAGLKMKHLVSVQVFCSDVSHFAAFNAVYRTYFDKKFPARAFLGSGPLLFGAKFELQGIAAKG